MKIIISILVLILFSFHSNSAMQQAISISDYGLQENDRIEALDAYWEALAKSAKEGDFDGMKSLYHEDAVLVKTDTTIAIADAFKFRWKKEIMEVKNGVRANTLEFRFSKRIGNETTAFEKGIYHYTSIERSSGTAIGDSYVHFEILLVKVNGRWLATMEHQKLEASAEEWKSLE